MKPEPKNSAESILAQIDRILSSPLFSRSQTLSRLLRFCVELTLDGKASELKEYRLGVDVLRRGKDFDPRIDPIVRMQAAKLRSPLAEYYGNEGREDSMVISIPKGGYVPTFTIPEISPAALLRSRSSHDIQSIAVLPFVSMSGDPENEYFTDGLTEELINALTYVPGLRVVARTSVFCFKKSVKDVREIGARLNVQTVLEGSVRRSGNQVRVTAQLIDVSTGYHLASRTYSRELKEIFVIQEQLADAVVTEIMPQGSADSSHRGIRGYATNLSAYNVYLKGMFALANKFNGPQESVAIFRDVLEQDPLYAPAWAGLAHSYFSLAWFSIMPAKQAMTLGKAAALRVLELDEKLGHGHAVLGMIQAAFEWNWHESEKSFERAISLQPSLSLAHHFYAILCLQPQGRYAEAISAIERALLLNPFDGVLAATATMVYAVAGDHDAAVRSHELAAEVSPRHPVVYATMGIAHETRGRLRDAVSMYRKACEVANSAPVPLSSLGRALARLGDLGEAKQILQQLLSSPHPSGFSLGLMYDGLGDRAQALRWLTHAVDEREPQSIIIPVDPRLSELRASPDFQQLLGHMNLSSIVSA